MFKMNRNLGKVNQSEKSIGIADGKAKIGDFVYYKYNHSGKYQITDIHISISLKDKTNQNHSIKLDDNGNNYCAEELFLCEAHTKGTKIANNKVAMPGEKCWLWVGKTLVRKIVSNRKNHFYYEDNPYYVRLENTDKIFGSKKEALDANPEMKQYLESAYKRQGRIFEREGV